MNTQTEPFFFYRFTQRTHFQNSLHKLKQNNYLVVFLSDFSHGCVWPIDWFMWVKIRRPIWVYLCSSLWWRTFFLSFCLHTWKKWRRRRVFASHWCIITPSKALFPPQPPNLPRSLQLSTSPLALKWASFHGNTMQEHIIPHSDFKKMIN